MADYDLLFGVMSNVRALPGEAHAREERRDLAETKVPSRLTCPITQQLLENPVVATDGFTYESKMLLEWFRRGHRTSPMTGAKLPSTAVIPNQNLRLLVEEWKERHPGYRIRPGRVRMLQALLDETERHQSGLSRSVAIVGLQRQLETMRLQNQELEDQVTALSMQVKSLTEPSGCFWENDEMFGFPED